uniref:non-specific serine/threonine protein kinase n=1 Tax=Ananas comosus var. bracteatus TaxID=296719 RepID=A0A6V7PBH4_ANACO|nr:unnamed protein product [Ananas comosus var. bracteatus]
MVAACVCTSKEEEQKAHNPMKYYADADPSSFKARLTRPARASAAAAVAGARLGIQQQHLLRLRGAGSRDERLRAGRPPGAGRVQVCAQGSAAQQEGDCGEVAEGRQQARGEEFHAEVDIIGRVHHRHLVSLVGYCVAAEQRLLVYEFVPNKTLEHHLHGKGLPVMDWPTRLKIALGSAKGIPYLHEDCHPRIIHRDIKSANILLDFKFEAMVRALKLARPVLSLALADRNYDELADLQLDGNYDLMEMARMVVCTAACVRHSAGRRPRMSQGCSPGRACSSARVRIRVPKLVHRKHAADQKGCGGQPEYSGGYSDPISEYGGHDRSASSGEGAVTRLSD